MVDNEKVLLTNLKKGNFLNNEMSVLNLLSKYSNNKDFALKFISLKFDDNVSEYYKEKIFTCFSEGVRQDSVVYEQMLKKLYMRIVNRKEFYKRYHNDDKMLTYASLNFPEFIDFYKGDDFPEIKKKTQYLHNTFIKSPHTIGKFPNYFLTNFQGEKELVLDKIVKGDSPENLYAVKLTAKNWIYYEEKVREIYEKKGDSFLIGEDKICWEKDDGDTITEKILEIFHRNKNSEIISLIKNRIPKILNDKEYICSVIERMPGTYMELPPKLRKEKEYMLKISQLSAWRNYLREYDKNLQSSHGLDNEFTKALLNNLSEYIQKNNPEKMFIFADERKSFESALSHLLSNEIFKNLCIDYYSDNKQAQDKIIMDNKLEDLEINFVSTIVILWEEKIMKDEINNHRSTVKTSIRKF